MIPSSADTCVSDGTTDAATNYWFTGNNTGGMITIPIDTCASDRTTGAAKKVRFTDPAGHGRWLRAPGQGAPAPFLSDAAFSEAVWAQALGADVLALVALLAWPG